MFRYVVSLLGIAGVATQGRVYIQFWLWTGLVA